MESKGELKEIDIKNRTCYSFDDIKRVTDFSDILLDKKSYFNLEHFIQDLNGCKTTAHLVRKNIWIYEN